MVMVRDVSVSKLQAPDCSQLLVEAAHLLGSLLLLLDRRLGSPTRERVVVAYFRLKGGAQVGAPRLHVRAGVGRQPLLSLT